MTTTFPPFEQWLEEHFPGAEHSDAVRVVYDRDRQAHQFAPAEAVSLSDDVVRAVRLLGRINGGEVQ